MKLRPMLRNTLLATLLWLPTAALAQAQTTATTATDATDMAALRELQQTAQRLTILNQVPEAIRADVATLLDRADALRQQAADLNRARLEAYVAALQDGSAPAVARAESQQQTAEAQVSLAEAQASLRTDVAALTADHPELQGLLARLSARGRAQMAGPGMQDGWTRPGTRNGSAGSGPFGSRGYGPDRKGQGSMDDLHGGVGRAPMQRDAGGQQRNQQR